MGTLYQHLTPVSICFTATTYKGNHIWNLLWPQIMLHHLLWNKHSYYFCFLSCRILLATKAFNFFRYAFSALSRCTSAMRSSSISGFSFLAGVLWHPGLGVLCTDPLPRGRCVPIDVHVHDFLSQIVVLFRGSLAFPASLFQQLLVWNPPVYLLFGFSLDI